MEPVRISPQDVKSRLDAGEPVVVVDSRAPDAWSRSDVKIPGAIRVPPDEADQHLAEISRAPLVVTYCT
jgi:rhodanese-related sulfurtransferase